MSERLRRGDTVPCSVAEGHAPHVWVASGFPYPLWCISNPLESGSEVLQYDGDEIGG